MPMLSSLWAQNYKFGRCGLAKNDRKAFELYLRAAELGHVSAQVSCCPGRTAVAIRMVLKWM